MRGTQRCRRPYSIMMIGLQPALRPLAPTLLLISRQMALWRDRYGGPQQTLRQRWGSAKSNPEGRWRPLGGVQHSRRRFIEIGVASRRITRVYRHTTFPLLRSAAACQEYGSAINKFRLQSALDSQQLSHGSALVLGPQLLRED